MKQGTSKKNNELALQFPTPLAANNNFSRALQLPSRASLPEGPAGMALSGQGHLQKGMSMGFGAGMRVLGCPPCPEVSPWHIQACG